MPVKQQTHARSALSRGLELVEALASEEARAAGGLGVVRIGQLVGREKSQISRALRTLAEAGFVDRDPVSLRYRVGWRLVALGLRGRDDRLVELARPLLARLVAMIGETAHLSVLTGENVLTLASEAPPHTVAAAGWVGRTVPAWCTASGRALLLDHDRDELDARVGAAIGEAGPGAPGSLDELARRITRDRARGFAVVEEELEAGLVAVAAPVRDGAGTIVAAINVSGPRYRLRTRLGEAGAAVRHAADTVSVTLAARVAA